jgi:hypothetical protein
MGLIHSAYIADLTFAELGDRGATRPEVRRAFGIEYYKRFRDDLLIITSKSHHMPFSFTCFRHRIARAFKILVTEISSNTVTMLAVTVSMQRGIFVCLPKARQEHVPLSVDSAHPTTVHRWWPVGYALGTAKLCSRESDFVRWFGCFLRRLEFFHTPPTYVAWLSEFVMRLHRNSSTRRPRSRKMWFVCDYHSAHEGGSLSGCVRAFFARPKSQQILQFMFADPPSVAIAWRCAGRRLVASTRVENRAVGGRGGGGPRGGT